MSQHVVPGSQTRRTEERSPKLVVQDRGTSSLFASYELTEDGQEVTCRSATAPYANCCYLYSLDDRQLCKNFKLNG